MNATTLDFDLEKLKRVSDLVVAYVSSNHIAVDVLPDLIHTIHAAIDGLIIERQSVEARPSVAKATSAQMKESLGSEFLISFIDGKAYKTLKRHLTSRGFTPDTYRAKFGLPDNYPMVAPSYSKKRSTLAKSIRLGQSNRRAPESAETKPRLKRGKKI